MWTAAAQTLLFADGAPDPTGVAAIIAAITGMILGVGGLLYKFTSGSDSRIDRISAESLAAMAAREKSAYDERDQARRGTRAAYEERDRWQKMWQTENDTNTQLQVQVARLEAENAQLRAATRGPTAGGGGPLPGD